MTASASIIAKGLGGLDPLMGPQVRTYGVGRVCAVCETPLSRYNPDNVCWLHREYHVEMKQCTLCGAFKPPTTDYFYRHSVSGDGLRSACKECESSMKKRRAAQRRLRHMAMA